MVRFISVVAYNVTTAVCDSDCVGGGGDGAVVWPR